MHAGEEDHAQPGWTTSTGLPVEESIRMTEDREKWRSTSTVWPTFGSRTAKEQNRTELTSLHLTMPHPAVNALLLLPILPSFLLNECFSR